MDNEILEGQMSVEDFLKPSETRKVRIPYLYFNVLKNSLRRIKDEVEGVYQFKDDFTYRQICKEELGQHEITYLHKALSRLENKIDKMGG